MEEDRNKQLENNTDNQGRKDKTTTKAANVHVETIIRGETNEEGTGTYRKESRVFLRTHRSNSFSEYKKTELKSPEIYVGNIFKKRKAEDITANSEASIYKKKENAVAADLKDILETLKNKLSSLNEIIIANNNTKKEIKEVNLQLQRIKSQLNKTTIKDWLETVKWEKPEALTYEVEVQTEDWNADEERVQKTAKNEKLEDEIKMQRIEDLRNRIKAVENEEDYQEILKEKWPEEVFEKTEIIEGNPLLAKKDVDIAICVNNKEIDFKKGIFKKWAEKYPEIVELEGENRVNYFTQETTIHKEGEYKSNKQRIYKIQTGKAEETDIREAFEKLGNSMTLYERKTVAIPRVSNIELNKLRKMIELTLKNVEIKVQIYTPGKKQRAEKERNF